jgi:hypothetical protein
LTNGTAYTFAVTATNSVGTGSSSTASASVTPSSGGGGGGGAADPYITTVSGISYKLPVMDAPIRFYQGEVDGELLTVNATLRTQSSRELLDDNLKSLITLSSTLGAKRATAIYKHLLEKEETLCFFDKIYISHGDKKFVAQIWDSNIRVKEYSGGFKTQIHQNTAKALSMTGVYTDYAGNTLDLKIGDTGLVSISIYASPMIRNGICVNVPEMSKGNGVVVNLLSKADMTLASLEDKSPVVTKDTARLRIAKESFIDHAGTRVRNIVTYK